MSYREFATCANIECTNTCEGNTEFCASCNRSRRKEAETSRKQSEKREQLLEKAKEKSSQPKARIKKVSPKREELNKIYFKLVEQFKKDNPLCKANVNEYCTKTTDDPHHRGGRGKALLQVDTWLPVCRNCHIYIEAHPKEAKEKGLSESRLAKHEPHKI